VARALALDPKLIVADEAGLRAGRVIQAQVVNLLQKVQQELASRPCSSRHDWHRGHFSQRIAVITSARSSRSANRESIYEAPRHPYTHALPVGGAGGRSGRRRARADPAGR